MAAVWINLINLKKKKRIQRLIRDYENPFDMPSNQFRKIYRMPQELAIMFIEELKLNMNPKLFRNTPIHIQFLVTLHFFASGSYQVYVGLSRYFCLSQPTVSKIITRMSNIIVEKMSKYIKFPGNLEELQMTSNSFEEKYNVPGIIGIIDGTHVPLAAVPKRIEYAYINRKQFHSINVQIVCDVDMQITDINALYSGSTHDTYIFGCSDLYTLLEIMHNENRRKWLYLIGDQGYPILPWVLSIYSNPRNQELVYNQVISEIRSLIERCIGLLKGRFRCLSSENKLHYTHTRAGKIIYSCAVLHNFLIKNRYNIFDVELDHDEVEHNIITNQRNQYYQRGLELRNAVCDYIANRFL